MIGAILQPTSTLFIPKEEMIMNMKSFFSFSRKKTEPGILIEKVKKLKSVYVGEMAAGNLKAATETLSMAMAQQHLSIKILTVQDGIHSQVLTDYAVKMAHKLDCEIIALDVSEEPLSYEGERRKRETTRFFDRAHKGADIIQLKAEAMGVKCRHIVKIGNQEETIKVLSQEDNSIRYVLTKPKQEQLSDQKRKARVQVFDLTCSRL